MVPHNYVQVAAIWVLPVDVPCMGSCDLTLSDLNDGQSQKCPEILHISGYHSTNACFIQNVNPVMIPCLVVSV